jgi:protein subunit release factor A
MVGFKLTKKDFTIEYMIGHGKGGQKKQKTSSACRITHEPSKVSKYCQDHREQHRNRSDAFAALCSDPRFKSWCQLRLSEIENKQTVEQWVEEQMKEENLLVEYL